MKFVWLKIMIAAILLFLGGLVYVAFRSQTLVMFSWFHALNLDSIVETIREKSISIQLPDFCKYCLPNGLWTSSYILMVEALISVDNHQMLWASILPGIAILFEILQIWHIIPGTFDMGDWCCFFFPFIIYIVIYNNKYHEEVP
jgi:hypothetical protein